jgi:hypothetical protein
MTVGQRWLYPCYDVVPPPAAIPVPNVGLLLLLALGVSFSGGRTMRELELYAAVYFSSFWSTLILALIFTIKGKMP